MDKKQVLITTQFPIKDGIVIVDRNVRVPIATFEGMIKPSIGEVIYNNGVKLGKLIAIEVNSKTFSMILSVDRDSAQEDIMNGKVICQYYIPEIFEGKTIMVSCEHPDVTSREFKCPYGDEVWCDLNIHKIEEVNK